MSVYDANKFLAHLLQALEDALEDTIGRQGMIALAIQVARRIRELAIGEFSNIGSINIDDLGEFVKKTSEELARKLGLHMSIDIEKENGTYKVLTKLIEKKGTPAIFIPITIVALALEEARQRGNKKFVISDAKISGDAFEFHLVPV